MKREDCISYINELNKKYHVDGKITTDEVLEEATKLVTLSKRPDEDFQMYETFLWYVYRKKLIELPTLTMNLSSLLAKYIDAHSMLIYDATLKDDMNVFLSFMDRDQFDYYMKRYFLLNETVAKDPTIEKEIGTIFDCKGPVSIYASMNRIKSYDHSEISLLKYSVSAQC